MAETVADLIKVLQQDRADKVAKEKVAEEKEKTAEKKRLNDERKADKKFKSDQAKLDAEQKRIENEAKLLRRQKFEDRKEAKAAYEKLEAERKQLEEDKQQLKDDREVVLEQRKDDASQRREDAKQKEKDQAEKAKISKEKTALELKKAAIDKKVSDLEAKGLDAEKDSDIVQSRIELLKDETELKNKGLTELQQRRNNQEANRKILEMQGRNADMNKKFLKDERELQRAELKDRLGKATSGSERKELLKEQAAKDRKSLSVFQKIELGVRNLGESFGEKFKGMASAGMGFLKKGALIALLFLLPKILNSEAAKNLVKFIQDKVIPFFKRMSNFFEGIFGEGTGGLVATLTAVGAILYGPTIVKLLFKAARGLVGAVMSLLSDSTTALGTDTKGRGRRRGRLGRIGSGLGKLVKGAGRGAGAAAKGVAGAATTVGKGVVSGAKSAGTAIAKSGAAAGKTAAGIIGKGGKVLAGAAKFAGPVGLGVTAAMGVFDGVTAGVEEFKKSGQLGKAVQEGLAGAASGLTFGLVSQETISGGMSKVGSSVSGLFKKKKDPLEGMDDFDKQQLGIDKRNELAMNKSELLRFEQNPKKYLEEVNKGRGKGGRGRKLGEVAVRKMILDNINKTKDTLAQLGEFGVGATETEGALMRADLRELSTTGMTAAQIIAQGQSDRAKGIENVAPVIINNDSSVRSNSSNTQVNNETITPRDGMLVSAVSDF